MKLEDVKQQADGQWARVLPSVAGLPDVFLDGRHHPCPSGKCGSRKDGFRIYENFNETGGCVCNQCGSMPDGFDVIKWMTGCELPEAIKQVAEFLGIKKELKPKKSKNPDKKQDIDPDKKPSIKPKHSPWLQLLVDRFCSRKQGIKPEAIKKLGGELGTYYGDRVISIPSWRESPDNAVGYVVLPLLAEFLETKTGDKVKVKTTFGSESGVLGFIDQDSTVVYKVEGVTDLLSLMSSRIPGSIITNAAGTQENPKKFDWLAQLLNGKEIRVIHDADIPGQDGATYVIRPNGTKRKGWAPYLAEICPKSTVKNIQLPYKIEPTKGKDLRDWLLEGNGADQLEKLATETPVFESSNAPEITDLLKADNDPDRLAGVILDQYKKLCEGKLIYWNGEWWKWKHGKYRSINEKELIAKFTKIVQKEIERCWLKRKDQDEPVQSVTIGLVRNVLNAMAGICVISGNTPMPCWLPDRKPRNYLSFKNGILDLDSLIKAAQEAFVKLTPEEKDEEIPVNQLIDCNQFLFPHTPDWFSALRLDYDFDPDANFDRWNSQLWTNLEYDRDRIAILQEYAGYLLYSKAPFQKFLILEGDGRNGKTVYFSGIEAMLGKDNVSHISLENFDSDFELSETIGKAANISGDIDRIEKVAEGVLKRYTGGGTMSFNRKYKDPISVVPTAKLMFAWNEAPRIRDRSFGIWRRMLIVPFLRKVKDEEIIHGMDDPSYWIQNGETPGLLMWALGGLVRLLRQQQFTISSVSESVFEKLRLESNPTAQFLKENVRLDSDGSVECKELFKNYIEWVEARKQHPLADNSFGKEIKRAFGVTRRKSTKMGVRDWYYFGISYEKNNAVDDESEPEEPRIEELF